MASTSRWTLDYCSPAVSASSKQSTSITVKDPPGLLSRTATSSSSVIKPTNLDSLRQQKAWELAMAPAKNVPMQAFMMYMTGGGVQIFSVMSVWFLLKSAVSGMGSVSKAFEPFASKTKGSGDRGLFLQKALYLACQLALLGVGLWKCNSMGLLPTHESDWLAFRPREEWPRVLVQAGERWERGAWR